MPIPGCVVRLTSELNVAELCAGINCPTPLINDSIVECNEQSQRLLTAPSSHIEACAEDGPTSTEQGEVFVPPGFYILEHIRFCRTQCIGKILIGSRNPKINSSVSPIQFHVYKRYRPTPTSNITSVIDFFVEKYTFDVSLRYNKSLLAFEAKIIGAPICVQRGDFLAFTLREGFEILGHTLIILQTHVGRTLTQCRGISSPVLEVNPFRNLVSFSALFSVQAATGICWLTRV